MLLQSVQNPLPCSICYLSYITVQKLRWNYPFNPFVTSFCTKPFAFFHLILLHKTVQKASVISNWKYPVNPCNTLIFFIIIDRFELSSRWTFDDFCWNFRWFLVRTFNDFCCNFWAESLKKSFCTKRFTLFHLILFYK